MSLGKPRTDRHVVFPVTGVAQLVLVGFLLSNNTSKFSAGLLRHVPIGVDLHSPSDLVSKANTWLNNVPATGWSPDIGAPYR